LRATDKKPWAAIFLPLLRAQASRYMQKVAMPCPTAQPCRFFIGFSRSFPADEKALS